METIESQIRGLFPQYEDFSKFQLLVADHDDWIKITVCGAAPAENRAEGLYVMSVLEHCGFELIEGTTTEGRDYVFCVRKVDYLDDRLDIHSGAFAQMVFCFRPTITNIKGAIRPDYSHITPTGFECALIGTQGDCDAVFNEACNRLGKLGYDLNRLNIHQFKANKSQQGKSA